MSIIKLKTNWDKHYYKKINNQINIKNWRTVGVLNSTKIEVVLFNFQKYIIHMSFDEFTNLSIIDLTLKKKYKYIFHTLSCNMCHGAGCVDWVQKVRMYEKQAMKNVTFYQRDVNVINKFDHMQSNSKHSLQSLYGSVPYLKDGFEICSVCKGTGLFSTKECGKVTNIL